MLKRSILLLAALLPLAAFAAGDQLPPKSASFSFEGPLGTVDRQAAQRGFQVYREVCASCHGLERIAFRQLVDLGFSQAEITALAREYQIQDGPNDEGDMFERPGLPSDYFPSPFANEQAARAANGGAYPPDLSLMVKARVQGAQYLYSLLSGYASAPQYRCVEARGATCLRFEEIEGATGTTPQPHPEGQHAAPPQRGAPEGGPTAGLQVNAGVDNVDPQQGALVAGEPATSDRGQPAVPADNLRQGGEAVLEGMASETAQPSSDLDLTTAAPADTAVSGAITSAELSPEGQIFECVAIDHGEGEDAQGRFTRQTCRQLAPGMYYNPYFPGGQIAMPPPLAAGMVSYEDGVESTIDRQSRDLVHFLQWTAEPEMEARKAMGLKVMIYLLILTVLVYIAKRKIWRRVH